MNDFVKFLTYYANEALSVSDAFLEIIDGLRLAPQQTQVIKQAIEKLQSAAKNIEATLPNVKNNVVRINKADLQKFVDEAVINYMKTKEANNENVNS